MINVNGASEAAVPTGTSYPVLDLEYGGEEITLTDSVSAPPASRLWTFESIPNPLSSPPVFGTPTSGTTTVTLVTDGTYTLVLTRRENDGTTNISKVIVGVLDARGRLLPSPGFDPALLAPAGVTATEKGWAGGAQSPLGDVFLSNLLRSMRDDIEDGVEELPFVDGVQITMAGVDVDLRTFGHGPGAAVTLLSDGDVVFRFDGGIVDRTFTGLLAGAQFEIPTTYIRGTGTTVTGFIVAFR